MFVIRPIAQSDKQSLYDLAEMSGYGFTSLPTDKKRLLDKIEHSVTSFARALNEPGNEFYLMVLEDTSTSKVVGCTGIAASIGLDDVFYHYRLRSETHYSKQLDIYNRVETLQLCNDYTCSAELCSLFLMKAFRGQHQGALLSRSRFLFLANHPERFGQKVIAEMRGQSDEKGYSPFYSWLQSMFLKMHFPKADHLCGLGQKSFIAELMPKHPIYRNLLPKKAQEVIAQVHENTKPAHKMLEREGFTFQGYIDIFDGGPTVECSLDRIQSVRNSVLMKVEIGRPRRTETRIVSNLERSGYRAMMISAECDEQAQKIILPDEAARQLNVVSGDKVRTVQ